jgi:hypothetical protein
MAFVGWLADWIVVCLTKLTVGVVELRRQLNDSKGAKHPMDFAGVMF